jgi:hypothetical protein
MVRRFEAFFRDLADAGRSRLNRARRPTPGRPGPAAIEPAGSSGVEDTAAP